MKKFVCKANSEHVVEANAPFTVTAHDADMNPIHRAEVCAICFVNWIQENVPGVEAVDSDAQTHQGEDLK